jgi:hypothetical protein
MAVVGIVGSGLNHLSQVTLLAEREMLQKSHDFLIYRLQSDSCLRLLPFGGLKTFARVNFKAPWRILDQRIGTGASKQNSCRP